MAQYRSPGVYVEEIDAGPKPIEGISTSICGAVGVTARGPTSGKPVLITSFLDFTRTFGGLLKAPDKKDQLDRWTQGSDSGWWWTFPLAVKAFLTSRSTSNGSSIRMLKIRQRAPHHRVRPSDTAWSVR